MSKLIKHSIDLTTEKVPLVYGYRSYEPPREVEKHWREAMAYLVFKWQFFAQMIYDGMEIVYTHDVPLAATDSVHIFVNHENLATFGIDDIMTRVFVLAHEVGHRVFGDLTMAIIWRQTGQVSLGGGRWLPYVHWIMNKAMDYRINAMLVEAKLGRMPEIGLFDKNISAKGLESCVEIYEKIYKDEQKKAKSGGGVYEPGSGKAAGSGFDGHLEPLPTVVAKEKVKREHAIVAAAEIAQRTNQGSIPGAIKLLIDEIVHPKVPWQHHLRGAMTRKAGEPKLDWRHRNRRLAGREDPLYFAKMGRKGAGLIVIGYDTSGSCVSPQVQQRFFAEAGGIVVDLNPERLIIVWCDAQVQRVDVLDAPTDLINLRNEINRAGGAPGGGGTNFVPVFNYVTKNQLKPDMLVYLTDTQGTFPDVTPSYPTIWCSIGGKTRVPFGELIHVEL